MTKPTLLKILLSKTKCNKCGKIGHSSFTNNCNEQNIKIDL